MTRQIILSLSALSMTAILGVHNAVAGTPITSIEVVETNVSGGGFQGDVTITEDGLTVYSSADVSGIFKSTDGGLIFKSINEGLYSPKVASLAITPDNDQILYAGTGDKGGSGGLFRSVDSGGTWTLTDDGDKAQFAGNHSADADPVPDGHPRSNGDLIVVQAGAVPDTHTDDIVIAGTYKNGVHIFFPQGGERAASSVNTSGFVRSIAHNPAVPNIAYAAIQFSDKRPNNAKNGIYKIDFTNPSNPVSTLEYSTLLPEGLTALSNGNVYGAISGEGIVKFNGSTWTLKNTGLSTNVNNRQWTAVTGYVNGSLDVIYAGANNLNGSNSNYSSIWRTVNGGNSWDPLVDANDNVSDQIYGQTYDWWFRTNAFGQAGLGRKNSVVSSIEVTRGESFNSASDDIIYVSGRGGIWKSENGGGLWQPAVFNMPATSNRDVSVNPNDPTQVVIGNTDFVVLETSDRFDNSNVSRDKPSGAESRGYDIIFDATSNELLLGVGDRDTNNGAEGEIYKKSADEVGNSSGSGWERTKLQEFTKATSGNDGRARAVTYGYHDGTLTTSQTILAAVEDDGVYRYHNNRWSKSTGARIGKTDRSQFVWPDSGDSGVVYLLDLSIGLFRSNDGGQNWSNIWPTMTLRNNDFLNTGYITADDNDPTTLYVSIQGNGSFSVFRMTGADDGIFGQPNDDSRITDITKHSGDIRILRPGPLVFGPDGNLWLTQQQNSPRGIDAALYVMENPATDASFKDVTTEEYRNTVIQPSGIDVSSDKHVYIAQNGVGVVKIKYDDAVNPVEPISPPRNSRNFWIPAEKFKNHTNSKLEGSIVDDPNGKASLVIEKDAQVRIIIGVDQELQEFVEANPNFEVCAFVANVEGGQTNTVRAKHNDPTKHQNYTLDNQEYSVVCSEAAPINYDKLLSSGLKVVSPSQGRVRVRGISIRPSNEGEAPSTSLADYELSRSLGYIWADGGITSNGQSVYFTKKMSTLSRHFESVATAAFGPLETNPQGSRYTLQLEDQTPQDFFTNGPDYIPDPRVFLTSVIEGEGAAGVGRLSDDANLKSCEFLKALVDDLNPQCAIDTCIDSSCTVPNCAFIASAKKRSEQPKGSEFCGVYLSGESSDWAEMLNTDAYHFVKCDRVPGGECAQNPVGSRPF